MYETLMPRQIKGGRAPAIARRAFLAERAGVSTTTLDDARRQLLARAPEGAFLARSAPRGCKRSVLHMVRRRPADTGERFAAVPAWTLDVVWAGRRRPPGMVSAEAWRLYASVLDKAARGNRSSTVDATVGRLAARFGVSGCTGRRRLAELEAAGLVEITQREGGWLSLQASLTPDQAAAAAAAFAVHGRRRISTSDSPSQKAALTPLKCRDTAPADSGTPPQAPTTEASSTESPPLPAVGAYSNQRRARSTAAKHSRRHERRRPPRQMALDAAKVYRILPAELTCTIPEHGSRRVLAALVEELQHRSLGELSCRVTRNWEYWRARAAAGEPIRDPVAVAIRIGRRGLRCPDVRCEDGHQLDRDALCKACAWITAQSLPPGNRQEHHVQPVVCPTPGSSRIELFDPPAKEPGFRQPNPPPPRNRPDPAAARRHATLARRLLQVRDPAEREALIAAHRAQPRSA
ncbi:hypothetical protein [Spirillospora sp. CA-128828]|uniref:hypothetical protein n=1 Tax=Spirillospora sp. CA-128828 TaxID=3240033 RepID=UPI003D94E3E5